MPFPGLSVSVFLLLLATSARGRRSISRNRRLLDHITTSSGFPIPSNGSVIGEPIFQLVLKHVGENNFLLNMTAKIVIILSLKPIDAAVERYLLHRLILKKRRQLREKEDLHLTTG